jgi:aminopeptidase N
MVKKSNILLLLLLCLAVHPTLAQSYEKGVSKVLAEQRAKQIFNVNYDLTFYIPEEQGTEVFGTAVIHFTLTEKAEIVLDFQGRFTGTGLVNGKKRKLAQKNEHIIVPSKYTKIGPNHLVLNFASLDKALNRNTDYLYTLFVPDQARSCFPCFDQPDMRATFSTLLHVPDGWKTLVSNGANPIPTYLYSFVAGKFEEKTARREGHDMRILYREQDPQKTSQIGKILDEAGQSLRWMEDYTGIKYPFGEFGMVVLPGYQFGGMEHPGAIQFTDRRIFLGKRPSQDEQLGRMELIAHETAHQWFGDMVALKWFEDVWTKEVFANFMAAKITRKQFSKIDHDLNFLRTYQSRAMAFDRTEGTHPIAQKLKNLQDASLLYDDIIYDKAPVMMRMLEDLMGAQQLQKGLQKYLRTYYFKSASWDDLIETLHQQSPDAGIREFSEIWVKQKGMPTIHTAYLDGKLTISQSDPYKRGIFWRQKFDIRLIYDLDRSRTITVDMQQPVMTIPIGKRPDCIIPNYDGRGYGRFTLDETYTKMLPSRLIVTRGDLERYSLMLTLFDNYLMGRINASYFGELYRDMTKERNPLLIQTAIDHMFRIASDSPKHERHILEQCITDLLQDNRSPDCRQTIVRKMAACATSPEVLEQLYHIWNVQEDPLFDDHDYMEMAYRLALMHPEEWLTIINQQHDRLKDQQLQEEFDYVSRACNPNRKAQTALFNDLLKPENRPHEPWALHALRLLNADVRGEQSSNYIAPSLKSLRYLQQTSDIFFVSNWLSNLLSEQKSDEALRQVETFLTNNPHYQENLRNKILVAAWSLKNTCERQQKKKTK